MGPQRLADCAASTAFFLLPPTEGDEPSLIQTNLLEGYGIDSRKTLVKDSILSRSFTRSKRS